MACSSCNNKKKTQKALNTKANQNALNNMANAGRTPRVVTGPDGKKYKGIPRRR